jgi:hypothetical protein
MTFIFGMFEICMAEPGNQGWIELVRARMTAKGKAKPGTKAGALRALWPAIEAALENGQTLKAVRDWLEEEGVHLTYNQLTSYVTRIRRGIERVNTAAPEKERIASVRPKASVSETGRPASKSEPAQTVPLSGSDPLANVRSREQKRPTFEYNSNLNEDQLI